MSCHVVKQVSAWKMSSEVNRNIEGAATSTRKIVEGGEKKLPKESTYQARRNLLCSHVPPPAHALGCHQAAW